MPPHHPVLDPAAAYPKIAELRSALDSRDWSAARSLLDTAEPVERGYLIQAGGAHSGREDLLRGVLAGQPADSTAGALLGQQLIQAGRTVRTARRARDVSREQSAAFHDKLRQAEIVLIDAAARTPDDPAVWTARITTARGLRLGRSEARRRYDRLAGIDPHFLPGQSEFLRQLCPKWGGDWPLAHAFARESADAAPPGTLNPVLVAEAHLEHWAGLDGDAAAQREHLCADPVRGELYEAAKRSVWHPEFRRTHGWVSVMSTFAMAFALLDDMPAVASMFTALGDLATGQPWSYLGDPATVISRYRARALPAGGAA
ncbi:hypothetical protein [Actinoplanes siamensis]|nr:hypothetical protein [Actinoplanes siamensis]